MIKRVPVYFSAKPESKEALRAMADDMDIPLSALVRLLLNEALKARGITRSNFIRRAA